MNARKYYDYSAVVLLLFSVDFSIEITQYLTLLFFISLADRELRVAGSTSDGTENDRRLEIQLGDDSQDIQRGEPFPFPVV